MTLNLSRSDPALASLQRAYDAYMAAEFGELIATADALTTVAKRSGYEFCYDLPGNPGVLPWVRKTLGVET